MNKSMMSILNAANIRSYFGFGGNRECYYRDGEVVFFDIGKLLVALTDIPIETLFNDLAEIYDEWETFFTQTDVHHTEFSYEKFGKYYTNFYKILSSAHILLGDQLVYPFLDEGINDALCDLPDFIRERINNSAKDILFAGNDKYVNFDCDNIQLFFATLRISFKQESAIYINCLLNWLKGLFIKLHMLNKCMSTLIPQTLVNNELPAHNFVAWEDQHTYVQDYYVSQQYSQLIQLKSSTNEEIISEAMKFFCSEALEQCNQVTGAMMIYTSEYDANYGYRWFTFYESNHISKIAYQEFAFMSINCIQLTTCKNCGKYFWAPSKAVRFCERNLVDRPEETCRSTSSEWYAINRSANSPGYDEYVLYKKRYRMRMVRNKEKNPYDRFRRWDHKARDVVFRYETDEISLDELKNLLLEMDKDMKPLDKM